MKWFVVTNRNATSTSFGNEPELYGKLHFCIAETPEIPARPDDLSMDYLGESSDPEVVTESADALKRELVQRCARLGDRADDVKPTLLLYTHGYNNDFWEAIDEYLEIRRNFHQVVGRVPFERHCVPVLFTWPSAGSTLAYLEDRDDARASAPAVKNMVDLLFRVTANLADCIGNTSVIAHSMGNYVFREALTALAGAPNAPAGTFVDQFVSIGADIGNTAFEPGGKGFGIPRFSNRVNVYFSAGDSTLRKSKRKNGRPRLGRTLSSNYQSTPDAVVFIDCKRWANKEKLEELFPIETPSPHSCYRSVPAILSDMFSVLIGHDRDIIENRQRIDLNKQYLLL